MPLLEFTNEVLEGRDLLHFRQVIDRSQVVTMHFEPKWSKGPSNFLCIYARIFNVTT
jgi:hypothetical protein